MMECPLVSIVLPTFNGQRYLAEAIESCLDQTYARWELIAVDDCSTDRTPEILREFAARDSRIRVIRNLQNAKLPRSLNVGFAAAKGDILTWTSDDNTYGKEALEVMVAELLANPEIALVYAEQEFIDSDGSRTSYQAAEPPEKLCYFNVVNACFAYRRRVWDELGGYDDEFRLVEDWEYWLRIACRFQLQPIPRCLYRYRQHEQTLTERHGEIRWRVIERVLSHYLPLLRPKWPAGYTKGFLRLCDERWQRGDVLAAWRHFGRAVSSPAGYLAISRWRVLIPLCFGRNNYFRLKARIPFFETRSLF